MVDYTYEKFFHLTGPIPENNAHFVMLLAFIIVTGAAVRLSGSGLGCSDWPTCENDQLVAEIDDVHAMVEFVNRVITGFVALAVIIAVLGSLFRTPNEKIYLSFNRARFRSDSSGYCRSSCSPRAPTSEPRNYSFPCFYGPGLECS